jgi:glutamyl-tRNA(Gln) amidotransferase subunit D
MEPKPGDLVELKTKDGLKKGILMPQDSNSIVIKLDNGYNIGIDKEKVEKMTLIKRQEAKPEAKEESSQKKGLPKIAILHTGGTIASQVDYETGGVTPKFTPQDILNKFPELRQIADIDSWLISNMWSEDMRFEHYRIMAAEVKSCLEKGYQGVIITHGTDTMAYTAAALSFILEELPIPVILVGSQRSSDRGSTDGGMNLICAAEFISKADFAGVAICMHENTDDDCCVILPACKTRKMHTSRRDAFKAINDKPIARIDYTSKKIDFLKKDYPKKSQGRKFTLRDNFEEKVGLMRVHPNMIPEEFEFYRGYKGLVIEAYALGQLPIDAPNEAAKPNLKNAKALKDLIDSGCVVAITSQCIFGRVHPHVYSKAVEIKNLGAIYTEDTLTETAFIKLAWLLGNHTKKETALLMAENLRGELNSRILPDEYLD